MTPDQATDVVALWVAADALEDSQDRWDGYPKIGEDDWIRVAEKVAESVTRPEIAEYENAYGLLASRAEHVA